MRRTLDAGVKVVGTTLFMLAAFMGVPLLIVGTAQLVTAWLGDTWYAGVLLAPVTLIEFCGGLSFFLHMGGRVGDWLTGTEEGNSTP